MKVVVHEAGLHDRAGASLVLEELGLRFPRMAKVWADSAYRGLKEWMLIELGWGLEVVRLMLRRPGPPGMNPFQTPFKSMAISSATLNSTLFRQPISSVRISWNR